MNTRSRRPLLIATLLAAFSAPISFADTPASAPLSLDQALKNFTSAPVSAPAASPDSGYGDELANDSRRRSASGAFTAWRESQSQLANIQSYFDNNDYVSALRQARQYARQATAPEIRQRWEDLVAALDAEQKKIEDALIAKIQAAISRAGETVLAARKASDLDATIEQFASMQESRSSQTTRVQRAYNRLNNAAGFLQQWQELLSFYENGDIQSARQFLRNFGSGSGRDRAFTRAQITEMATALGIAEPTPADVAARIDPLIARAAEIALAPGTKPEALDPILSEIDVMRSEYENAYGVPLRRARDRLTEAVNFFRVWQDYLAAREGGDLRDARQLLRNLNANSYANRPIPRSRIQAISAALAADVAFEMDQALANLDWKTLPLARERIVLLQEQTAGRQTVDYSRIIAELDRLAAARAALDAGQPAQGRAALETSAASAAGRALPTPVVALRDNWWFEAMPALSGSTKLPARVGDESAAAFAHRQFETALTTSDWSGALRFAQLERSIVAPAIIPETDAGIASLAAFLRAEKLLRAGQTKAAAEAWREVLAGGAPATLEEAAIDRLRTHAIVDEKG